MTDYARLLTPGINTSGQRNSSLGRPSLGGSHFRVGTAETTANRTHHNVTVVNENRLLSSKKFVKTKPEKIIDTTEHTFEDSETYVNKLYKRLFPEEKKKLKKNKQGSEQPYK